MIKSYKELLQEAFIDAIELAVDTCKDEVDFSEYDDEFDIYTATFNEQFRAKLLEFKRTHGSYDNIEKNQLRLEDYFYERLSEAFKVVLQKAKEALRRELDKISKELIGDFELEFNNDYWG